VSINNSLKKELETKHLKQLLAQNKIHQVFDELNAFASSKSDPKLQNKITILKVRWKALMEDQHKGIISIDNFGVARNKIHDDILVLLDEEGKSAKESSKSQDETEVVPTEKPKKVSWKSILTILGATIAMLAGIAEISGYSIRDWFEKEVTSHTQNVPSQVPTDTTSSPIIPPDTITTEEVEELPKAKPKLQVQIKTQKGDRDLTFKESEEVQLFFKVNRPCKLRTIYRLADGTLILLDNDRLVNKPETNKWVQLSDGFEVAPPFGAEELYIFAQEKDFPVLMTEEKDGYTIIKEGLPIALSKTRGLKKKPVFAEDKLNITTKKNN